MSFSVRVHPAPFSPTPNRHAGIGLKMKSVGPGGSRFELVGLLDPQREEHKRCRSPKKRSTSWRTPPPRRRRWQRGCGWLWQLKRRIHARRGGTQPLSSTPSLPVFPLAPRHLLPAGFSSHVVIAPIYSCWRWCCCTFLTFVLVPQFPF